jgi:glycosyltransferase involved in cell wall biosynthesis
MKVIYINYLFDKQDSSVGAAVHVREFVDAARQAGANIRSFDLNKFSQNGEIVQPKSRAWLKKRLSRYLNELNALLSNVGTFRREWKIVSAEKPDAILVRYNLLSVSAAMIARLKRIPFILEVNAPMALESRQFNHRVVHLPFLPEWIERVNLRLANKVVTVSQALKNYFVEAGIDSHKIHVVPNGVSIDAFRPEANSATVRQQLKLGDAVVVGFVGSFHYWHGVDQLNVFVKELALKYQRVKFLFVGSGPLKDECEAAIQKAGLQDRVVFTGYIDHKSVPDYLAAMDITLAPYPHMDFFYFSPLKLFEYMAAGKAVVASRIGQISEMIDDGQSGLMFEPGNFQEMLAKTSELIENKELRERLGRSARKTILDGYTWRVNAERILQIIGMCLNGKH